MKFADVGINPSNPQMLLRSPKRLDNSSKMKCCPRAKDHLWSSTERPGIMSTTVTNKTIRNALNRPELYARSPCQNPLLKKKQLEVCLKFA